jgi:hypothetical protein
MGTHHPCHPQIKLAHLLSLALDPAPSSFSPIDPRKGVEQGTFVKVLLLEKPSPSSEVEDFRLKEWIIFNNERVQCPSFYCSAFL